MTNQQLLDLYQAVAVLRNPIPVREPEDESVVHWRFLLRHGDLSESAFAWIFPTNSQKHSHIDLSLKSTATSMILLWNSSDKKKLAAREKQMASHIALLSIRQTEIGSRCSVSLSPNLSWTRKGRAKNRRNENNTVRYSGNQ